MDLDTTIVAVSSPCGSSPRAMVRVSGMDVFERVQHIGISTKRRTLTACSLRLREGTVPVLCASFPADSSFTGQETIEIILPNNQFLIDSLLNQFIELTAGRHAEAGEFTARAFFNGRISLSEAEGVCATISATNDGELRGAALLRNGALHSQVTIISDQIRDTLARVESGIDFTDEEDVVAISNEELLQSITLCIESIQAILDRNISMATLSLLPKVVIAGVPNSGKSTLFNALLGYSRVIVSDTAGTTRDAIQEPVQFGAKEAMLVDIAGFEDGGDDLSLQTQQVASRMVEEAELVLYCVAPDGVAPLPTEGTIVVYTKSDLHPRNSVHDVCAVTGDGLEHLITVIEELLCSRPLVSENSLALLTRHEHYLQQTLVSLEEAKEEHAVPELVAASLRESLNRVGTITGVVTPDEVLGEVFSSFCIGK